jgi:hypothetical protein
MYIWSMKAGKNIKLSESPAEYKADPAPDMVRTQIYLTRQEHGFLTAEARRKDQPMAAIIRGYIDEKMKLPDDAWVNNPLLQPAPVDPDWEGHEDGGLNHDHYVYGTPKRYQKVKGKWVRGPEFVDE